MLASGENNSSSYSEYKEVWKWFIYRLIVNLSIENNLRLFLEDDNFDSFVACVNAPKKQENRLGWMSIFPKMKRGSIEVEGGIEVIKGKLGLDFEWEEGDSARIKFSKLVRKADELFQYLKPNDYSEQKICILFDELELSIGNRKQYTKDSELIRDLIFAIAELNILSINKKLPVSIIAAIRSEVLSSLPITGAELNKRVEDFGLPVEWSLPTDGVSNHPLLDIIKKRLKVSEKYAGLQYNDSSNELWNRYFPGQIENHKAANYILHQTWFRPRDVVRLLSLCQELYPNENDFNNKVFRAIRQKYSERCWIEQVEELRVKFSVEEIEGIKKLLMGISSPFSFHQITLLADARKKEHISLKAMIDKFGLGEILSQLYKVGIIGNSGERIRFEFRGDRDLLLDQDMKIHDALWNHLSVRSNKTSNKKYL
jgi:hypothetical protein